jgi:DNA-binding NarL/FixJ family response regulator
VIRVLIVAPSPQARSVLQDLLPRGDYDVVGKISDLAALADTFAEIDPDVVLAEAGEDSESDLLDAISAADMVHDSAVILLAEHPSPGWTAQAIRRGVRAVLPADAPARQLRAAIHAAVEGLVVLPSMEAGMTATAPLREIVPAEELPEALTRREREVLQMLASGLANKEIAAKLNLSDHTVKFHVASILGKLGAASRTEAVAIGIRRGLVLL